MFAGYDSVSAIMLVFLGMYFSWKLYSCRSACHQAIHWFRFLGNFQGLGFTWSVYIVKGTLVHPKYGLQCAKAFIMASNSHL